MTEIRKIHNMNEVIMQNIEKKYRKQILYGVLLALGMVVLFLLVYKAQIEPHAGDVIVSTVMSEHKTTSEVIMSAEAPIVSEVFVCKVPKLKQIRIACKGKNISEDASLLMTLTEIDTGKVHYKKEVSVKKIISTKSAKVRMKMKKSIKDSEGKIFILSWQLLNPGDTVLTIKGNYKPGIVHSFNGIPDNKTNIIYNMRYSKCKELFVLYIALCIALLILAEVSYVLIVVKKKTIVQFYIPIALILGMIFNAVIVLHGVPDEPGHVDTAYKYSNQMLFVEDTGIPGTIYKRQCDVELQDMLANGVETNSYYQMLEHTFEKPSSEDLIAVQYTDSSNLVPGIIYYPAALGISIGRLLGLSAFVTLCLGRMMNLLVFVLLTWCAIRTIPFGKNMLGWLGMLPIAMQQGASVSYDPVINGLIILFIALCFSLSKKAHIRKLEWCLLAVLVVLVAMSKSGAYLPVLLLVLLLLGRQGEKRIQLDFKKVLLLIAGCILIAAVLAFKFMPTIQSLFFEDVRLGSNGEESLYTLSYILKHPLSTLYMYWNTFMHSSATHLRGLLGGMLGWLDIKVNWVLLIIILIGGLLLVNVEGERYEGTKRQRILMVVAIVGSVVIIMLSMLLAWTPIESTRITGLQGRYYYALAPMMLLLTSNHMISVNKEQCSKIWMTMLVTEVLIVLQVVATVL